VSPVIVAVGLGVGVLVGLSGVGGGSLLTPVLGLIGVPIPVAVGTALVYGVGTRLMAVVQHARQGAIAWRWAAALAAGGMPMAVIGSLAAAALARDGALLAHAVGATLVLAGAAAAAQEIVRARRIRLGLPEVPARASAPARLVPLGAAIGLIVGLTSVGAGSLAAPALLMWSGLTARRVVGTDVASGLALSLAAAFAHARGGTVDWPLVWNLMAGSLPGAWIGSRLTLKVRNRPLRTVLSGLVLASGLRLI
jgi:uncharacterized membrane protein YfcA